jgi:hypothetical protein
MNVASQEFVSQETPSKEYETNYDDEKSWFGWWGILACNSEGKNG